MTAERKAEQRCDGRNHYVVNGVPCCDPLPTEREPEHGEWVTGDAEDFLSSPATDSTTEDHCPHVYNVDTCNRPMPCPRHPTPASDPVERECECGHLLRDHTKDGCSGWTGPSLYALCCCPVKGNGGFPPATEPVSAEVGCEPPCHWFRFGAATVECWMRDKRGNVIGITTPRQTVQVFVTPSGLVRVFRGGRELR